MKTGLRVIFTIASGIALGTMVFFIAIVAIQIFASLPLETAGNVLGNIFPPYYTLTTLLCVVSLLSYWVMTKKRHGWGFWTGLVSLLVTTSSMLMGWLVLLPVMNRLLAKIPTFSGPQTPLIQNFFMYHGLSMGLNLLALVLLLLSIIIVTVTTTRN